MNQQQAHQFLHLDQTFLTKHGEIIFGQIESYTPERITILDQAKNQHIYPLEWVDIGENRNNIVHGKPYKTYDRQAKKLLIIGAGASHDFSTNPNLDYKPPLSNSLFNIDHFNILKSRYPKIQEYLNTLSAQDNLESKLLQIYQRAKRNGSISNVQLLTELNYYLAEIFLLFSLTNKSENRSNYLTLLNYIREYLEDHPNEEIIIINFNYDTILDNAIEKIFGISYLDPNDYLGSETIRIKMFKVHGSCNWVRQFVKISNNAHYLEKTSYTYSELPEAFQAKEMHLGHIQNYLHDEIKVINFQDLKGGNIKPRLEIGPFFPHLLIPMNDKDAFMIPQNQLRTLESSIKEIDEIITIGWKGEEKQLISLFEKIKLDLKHISIVDFMENESMFDIKNFHFQDSLSKKYNIHIKKHLKGFSAFAKDISNSNFSLFK